MNSLKDYIKFQTAEKYKEDGKKEWVNYNGFDFVRQWKGKFGDAAHDLCAERHPWLLQGRRLVGWKELLPDISSIKISSHFRQYRV